MNQSSLSLGTVVIKFLRTIENNILFLSLNFPGKNTIIKMKKNHIYINKCNHINIKKPIFF